MHVLLVTQDFPPDVGGTQTWSAEIARGLLREGHAVTVVCPALPGDENIDAAFQAAGIRVIRVAASYDAFPLLARRQLRSIVATQQVDVALAVAWPSALALRLAGISGRSAGRKPERDIPVVLAVHGRELLLQPLGFPGGRLLYDRLRKSAVRSADRFIPVSRYSASLLEPFHVPESAVHVVNNGTDPDVFRPAPEAEQRSIRNELGVGSRPMILSVCRLVGRKGVDTVIRALPRVLQTVPDAVYVVAGDGPDADYLEALARAEGVDDHVIFAGRLSWEHLRACYTAAQVFALPARQADPDVEGFGIVFLEANACETPVIGARTGGIPDAIADGQSGLLVPPDHPEALAEALVRLLSDPERASEMGRQGRRRVLDGFTWSHAAERIARILTSMKYFLLIPFLVLTACSSPDGGSAPSSSADSTESPFVALSTVAPGVIYDLRYLTNENFLGRPVAGYIDPVCLLTPEAAAGLARAQALAEARGLTLQVFDCYRPQTAVNDFVAWAADPADTLMQSAYYPRVPKDSLFAQGYIAERSGHSRGSTVDLALARDGVLLDFGTPYDYFDVVSHTADSTISAEARANRDLLVDIMGEAGFTNYAAEWWHYTLRSEPYDGTYFDLPVISPM